tara:strand:- start:416 stop:1036 length:621 start_codon:yes stop_codon:yes gene_type:complete
MGDFKLAYPETSAAEGLYSNNKKDFGAETYGGISRRFWPDSEVWQHIDGFKHHPNFAVNPNATIEHDFMKPLVERFYRVNFWDAINGDEIPEHNIAAYLYDIAVNKGVNDAVEYLQTGCNISNRNGRDWGDIIIDGDLGNKTIEALTAWIDKRSAWPCLIILAANIIYHWQLQAVRFPEQQEFINGILARHLKRYAKLAKQYSGVF